MYSTTTEEEDALRRIMAGDSPALSVFTGAAPADDDSPGIVTTPGRAPDPADEAGRYLRDYDMSALDELAAGRGGGPPPAREPGETPPDPHPHHGAEDSVLRSDQMQGADLPEGWYADSAGAIAARGGDTFDFDARPTSMQGFDDASRTTRDRGTRLDGLGARTPGTLDMSRPDVQVPGGGGATVRSASFGTDDGEVLLPTISPDGREWSDDEAFDAYRSGGGHLGIYGSPEEATAAAETIHNREGGYPADDNEATEAAYGPEMALEGPNAEIYGEATDADPTMAASPGAEMPSVDDETGFWGSATDADPELPGSARVFPLGEGFNDPDRSTSMAAEPPPAPEDMTEWDAMSAGLDGRVFEDGSIGWPEGGPPGGYPADDDEATEAARGIHDDEAAEEPGGLALADPRGPSGLDEVLADPEAALKKAIEEPRRPGDGARRAATIAAMQQIVASIAQLGSALSGGRGGSFRPADSSALMAAGEALDADAARQLAEGRQAEAAARGEGLARDRMASQERIAAMRSNDEPNELELSREERLRARDEHRAEIDRERSGLTRRQLDMREGATEAERAAAERRANPASDESARARTLLETEIATLSPALRESLSGIDISGLNADEADAYRDDLPALLRDRMGRGRGGAGGGGGGARDALRQALVASGMTQEEADLEIEAMGTQGARRSLTDRRRAEARAEGESSGELISGTGIVPTVELEGGEARSIRGRLTAYRDGWSSLDEIESLVDRYGAGRSVLDPEVQAELEPANLTLIAMVATIQNSGTLNAGERPIIEATLPRADAVGMTLGRYAGALRGWRTRISGAAASAIAPVASGAENRDALDRWLRTGEGRTTGRGRGRAASGGASGGGGSSSSSSSAAPADVVRVRGPDGTVRRVPRDRIPAGGVPEGFEVLE